jgi:hypothetical protein
MRLDPNHRFRTIGGRCDPGKTRIRRSRSFAKAKRGTHAHDSKAPFMPLSMMENWQKSLEIPMTCVQVAGADFLEMRKD